MNPIDRPSNPVSTSNEITRRSFMKKTALTAGAITLLGQGVGFALVTEQESCSKNPNPGNHVKTARQYNNIRMECQFCQQDMGPVSEE